MAFRHKHLLGIQHLSRSNIQTVLDTAESMLEISTREVKKVPALRGKTIVNLFYEPSTRTRSSFEIAAKRLSADIMNFNRQSSSIIKGETLKDTIRNLEAMQTDAIVIRHESSGVPNFLSTFCSSHIINAGDGMHEHPTQALLDAFTIKQRLHRIQDLKIVIVGDILHSRVARSNMILFQKLGAHVTLVGPPSLCPQEFEWSGAQIDYNMDRALEGADVVMMLRIQLERQTKNYIPSIREYREMFGLTREKFNRAKKDAIIMHPGPVNRGVELDADLADSSESAILEQVANGIAVRMAVLYLLLGGTERESID
ncbi:MAG: aspartate carbamoyltransferase catalytic subunit [Candidatus Aminicenantes bacterium]